MFRHARIEALATDVEIRQAEWNAAGCEKVGMTSMALDSPSSAKKATQMAHTIAFRSSQSSLDGTVEKSRESWSTSSSVRYGRQSRYSSCIETELRAFTTESVKLGVFSCPKYWFPSREVLPYYEVSSQILALGPFV
ncbi:hypothetical protein C8J57DRAFT_1466978 [Mycena rebaudengoi]|nr:hypothetical protein C8J57DRAFT_1466978 [Mycena rebaudengoi]